MTVYIVNTAPTYVSSLDHTTNPGVNSSFILPATKDAEGHNVN